MKSYAFLLLLVAAERSVSESRAPVSNEPSIQRQRRSVKIPSLGSIFGGKKEPEVPHLGTYPLWKVHRYHGISLQPISIPGDQVPSSLPIPSTLPGEAPSIVNVPNLHQASREFVTPPPNEYGPPPSGPYPPSAPYPPASPPAPYPPASSPGPYPPASQPGPYPPASPPGPYPPASPPGPYPPASPPGPYPPASPPGPYPPDSPSGPYSPPTAPHPPVFNAQAHSNPAASSSIAAGPSGYSGPPSEFAEPPFNAGAQGGAGNFVDLQSMLPPELAQKLQQYTSTPQGRERVSALLRIAANAQKLKTNAASSLQGIFQKFFGGAGGSENIALESGTYTNIPKVYPAHQGIFNSLKPVGTGISGSLLPNLPDAPPLPKIPGLKKLPPTPGLPHINLPAVPLKEAGGQYVSFSIPQGHAYGVPAQSYNSVPAIPATSYGTPVVGDTFVPSSQPFGGEASSFFKSPDQTNSIPNSFSPAGDVSSFYQAPLQSYGTPSAESSGGDISTFFQAPSPTYGLSYDSSSAGSEVEEEFQPRQNQDTTGEVVDVSPTHLKTTKLHRLQNTVNYQREDTRTIANQQPVRQIYQGFQPMEQSEQNVEESLGEDIE